MHLASSVTSSIINFFLLYFFHASSICCSNKVVFFNREIISSIIQKENEISISVYKYNGSSPSPHKNFFPNLTKKPPNKKEKKMVKGSCKEKLTPFVFNQKHEGICLSIALSQMMTTTLILNGDADEGLLLSPQKLIDVRGYNGNISKSKEVCCGEEYGLETLDDDQFVRLSRGVEFKQIHRLYQTPRAHRYRLKDIQIHRFKYDGLTRAEWVQKIKNILCEMFGNEGKKFPCVANVWMVNFTSDVARDVVSGNRRLYRPTEDEMRAYKETSPQPHAILIVGINTDYDDESRHYCEIKNSYGPKWGAGGFSWIPFDFIWGLFVPVPH